jgi:hypothetical protein
MQYIDIGHTSPAAVVWVFKDRRLWTTPASVGTHEALYGMDALRYWRGRYEPDTTRCSATPPTDARGGGFAGLDSRRA